MERPCTGLVFLQACQWSFFVAVITLGLRQNPVLSATRKISFSVILLLSLRKREKKSRENPEKETVCMNPCCVWKTFENSVNTGDKAERQPRKNRLGRRGKTTCNFDWKQDCFSHSGLILEKKKKRKKRKWERRKGKEKEAKMRSGLRLARRVRTNRAEQTEDKKDCLFENNSVCPVTLDKVTVKM